ncbi:hypothetical protein SAMN04490244_1237 [Tranquillimonas rosea]|uniref:DUF2218 domain-containing protein n=1 Tax=Tranquillimonas rosea TaxID=641238 RepID=A0A1H9XAH3_9RHOB|nr:DUF2218 domain-containing protein [Tranquillimonas rosea]SES43059.1 hypothetical protein SAMN04490244_1237 [Tranquillimonas rosea]
MKTATRIPTAHASRYLQQLCKHFAHKIEAEHTAEAGECRFPHSTASFRAESDALDIVISSDSRDGLESGKDVVWSHLRRFAFREELPEPRWQAA